jgi:hypothetical protein
MSLLQVVPCMTPSYCTTIPLLQLVHDWDMMPLLLVWHCLHVHFLIHCCCTHRHMQSGLLPIKSTTYCNLLTTYQRWVGSNSNDHILFHSHKYAVYTRCKTELLCFSHQDVLPTVMKCRERLYWLLSSLLAFVWSSCCNVLGTTTVEGPTEGSYKHTHQHDRAHYSTETGTDCQPLCTRTVTFTVAHTCGYFMLRALITHSSCAMTARNTFSMWWQMAEWLQLLYCVHFTTCTQHAWNASGLEQSEIVADLFARLAPLNANNCIHLVLSLCMIHHGVTH